jgi:hypothetical protein
MKGEGRQGLKGAGLFPEEAVFGIGRAEFRGQDRVRIGLGGQEAGNAAGIGVYGVHHGRLGADSAKAGRRGAAASRMAQAAANLG